MAVGLRKSQTMTNVLLPQAVTAMLPAIVSQLVVIVKDTALGGVMIGFTELLNTRGTLAANYANVVQSFVVVAVIYIVLNFILTSFASWLEGRLRRGKKSTGVVLGPATVAGTAATGAGGSI
jgi:glutamate transport system permease protein